MLRETATRIRSFDVRVKAHKLSREASKRAMNDLNVKRLDRIADLESRLKKAESFAKLVKRNTVNVEFPKTTVMMLNEKAKEALKAIGGKR